MSPLKEINKKRMTRAGVDLGVRGVEGDGHVAQPDQVVDGAAVYFEILVERAHAAREDTATAESDAVSAMLTAIQDFVADSFLRENKGQKLDSIEFGDYNIWLISAPKGVLAAVVRGEGRR